MGTMEISDGMRDAALAAYRTHRSEYAGLAAALEAAGLPGDRDLLEIAVGAYRKGQDGQHAAMTRALTAVITRTGEAAARRGALHKLIRDIESLACEVRLLSGGQLSAAVVPNLATTMQDRQGLGWHEAHEAADLAIDLTGQEN